jgi:hypothetical protein
VTPQALPQCSIGLNPSLSKIASSTLLTVANFTYSDIDHALGPLVKIARAFWGKARLGWGQGLSAPSTRM